MLSNQSVSAENLLWSLLVVVRMLLYLSVMQEGEEATRGVRRVVQNVGGFADAAVFV